MLRLLFRFIGLLILAGAFAALVIDGTRSVANGAVSILPFDRTAAALSPAAFETFHKFVQTHTPSVWGSLVVPLLRLPVWLVLGVAGLLLLALTRRRNPKIGYSRR